MKKGSTMKKKLFWVTTLALALVMFSPTPIVQTADIEIQPLLWCWLLGANCP